MKTRWFNYRPLCLIFIFLALGSLFSFYITKYVVPTIIISLLILAFVITIAVFKRKLKYFLIPIVAFVFAVGAYHLAKFSFNKSEEVMPELITARIYNVSKPVDGEITLHVDSVSFDDKKVNSNMIIYVYDNTGLFENLEIGKHITFNPRKVYKSDLFYRKLPNSNLYAKNLKYSATVTYSDILFGETDKTFAEIIKAKVRDNLDGMLTNENVEIAYSSLFGDKSTLFDMQRESYKLSGVAHLMAVSGLHVGIIVGILSAILKLFKANGWVKLGVVSAFLLLYCYICSFSVSVVRASIMAICLLLAGVLRREYDSLSAISLAGIILFVFNPFVIFDVSFILSFSCVLGIVMIYRPIKKALLKTKMPAWLADALALSVSVTVSIIFAMAYFFKTLNVISIFANVILIPIFTVAFTILFVISMFALILPFLKYLLVPLNPVFNLINLGTSFFGGLRWSNLATVEFQFLGLVLYFVLLLILSRLCTAKRGYRVILTLPIVAILVLLLI